MEFTPETLTWVFLVGGGLLMLLETIVPGGVLFFLGLSGCLVAALRFLEVLTDPVASVFVWLVASLVLVVAGAPFLRKYFGGSSSYKLADEDYEAMDQVVTVLEDVTEEGLEGRIRFRGASWRARTLEGSIPAGAHARIVYRDNLTWIVEPAGPPELDLPGDERLPPSPTGDRRRDPA